VLANGPSQSGAPQFPIVGGEQPGYGNYNAVACASPSRCFAVGADNGGNGVAGSSVDGGDSWSNESLPAGSPPLDAIACADSTHCVAVGQGATAATSDGGTTWDLAAVPVANTTMIGVTCLSTQTCLAAGVTSEQAGPYAGVILISTNGGLSWTSSTLPPGTYGIGDVVCPTSSRCIAVGAQILVSSDGGQTWSTATVPGGTQALRSIACSSSTTCVAIGPNSDAVSNPNATTVAIMTTDGGSTWTQDAFPTGSASLEQISCPSSSQCFAGGPSLTQNGPAAFFTSSNSGASWTAAPSAPKGISAVAGLSCPAVNDCAVVGRQANGQAATAASTDLTTWATTTLPGDAVPPPTDATSP
jgi:photosystem II stability/assembly factor-like uncharacterized protein